MKQNADDLEARMRAGECYHSLRVPPNAFIVVRVDGRSFSRFTERMVEKPFDSRFHQWMIGAAKSLLVSLQAIYAYTESDEISVLLPRATDIFDREVEKLVSLSAARASSSFTLACGEEVEFDARVWVGARSQDVIDYFRWRQGDCVRCAINGWCYWTLRKAGKSVKEATLAMEKATVAQKRELLSSHGIAFDELPLWQRRGTAAYFQAYEKDGFNPKTGATVKAIRRRVVVDDELPLKDAYSDFVRERIAHGNDAATRDSKNTAGA